MKKIENFDNIKREIELNLVELFDSSNDIAFRSSDSFMSWGIVANENFYNIRYFDDKILFENDNKFLEFKIDEMDSFRNMISSLGLDEKHAGTSSLIQNLANSATNYDLVEHDNGVLFDTDYSNGTRIASFISDAGDAKYSLLYENGDRYIPIDFNDNKVSFEYHNKSLETSLDGLVLVSEQITALDKDTVQKDFNESRVEKNYELHQNIINSISPLYASAESVEFHINRNYDAMIFHIKNGDNTNYKIVVDEGVVSVYHDKEQLLRTFVDNVSELRTIVNEENPVTDNNNLKMIPFGLTKEAYEYSIEKEPNSDFKTVSIDYENGLSIIAHYSSSKLEDYSLSFDKDGIEIPIVVKKDGLDNSIYVVENVDDAKVINSSLPDFRNNVIELTKLDSTKIEELIAKTENLNITSDNFSIDDVKNKLLDATSGLYYSSIYSKMDVDRENNTVELFCTTDAMNDKYHGFSKVKFIVENDTINVSLNHKDIGQWSVSEIRDMKKDFLDELKVGMPWPLEAFSDSLKDNLDSFKTRISYYFPDESPESSFQSFFAKYNNGLILEGNFLENETISYRLAVDTKEGPISVIAVNDLLCVSENVDSAITCVGSINELTKDVEKFNHMSAAEIKEAIDKAEDKHIDKENPEINNSKEDINSFEI